MKLKPQETDLIGKWVVVADGNITKDETTKRIEILVNNYLERVAADKSGWDTLYRDTSDNRYWELTYPESAWQGGGPPRLTFLPKEQVKAKYGDVADIAYPN